MSASEKDLGLSWNWTDHHCPSLVAPVKSYCDNLITILVSRNTLLRVSSLSRCCRRRALISSCFKLGEIDQRQQIKADARNTFGKNVSQWIERKQVKLILQRFLTAAAVNRTVFFQRGWSEKRFYGEQVWIVIRLPTARCAKSRRWNISVVWRIKKSVRHKPVRQQRRRRQQRQRQRQRQRQQLVRREAFYESL